jgi:hypothetical protein
MGAGIGELAGGVLFAPSPDSVMGYLSARSDTVFSGNTVCRAVSQIEPTIQLRWFLILFRQNFIAEFAEEKNAEDRKSILLNPLRDLGALCVPFVQNSERMWNGLFLRPKLHGQRMTEPVFVRLEAVAVDVDENRIDERFSFGRSRNVQWFDPGPIVGR